MNELHALIHRFAVALMAADLICTNASMQEADITQLEHWIARQLAEVDEAMAQQLLHYLITQWEQQSGLEEKG